MQLCGAAFGIFALILALVLVCDRRIAYASSNANVPLAPNVVLLLVALLVMVGGAMLWVRVRKGVARNRRARALPANVTSAGRVWSCRWCSSHTSCSLLLGIPLGLFGLAGRDVETEPRQLALLSALLASPVMLALFLLLFEARARYVYLYAGYFVLLSAFGYDRVFDFVRCRATRTLPTSSVTITGRQSTSGST